MNSDADRLEDLWRGQFGAEYTLRNPSKIESRLTFWAGVAARLKPKRVLEVGCNRGLNLAHLAMLIGSKRVYGVDINCEALTLANAINVNYAQARDLPFKDGFFDLTFTCGVLIHQPLESLHEVIAELVRCSKRYVLVMEYASTARIELQYRGKSGALWKDDYGKYLLKNCAEIVEQGTLGKDEGFDELTYWVGRK